MKKERVKISSKAKFIELLWSHQGNHIQYILFHSEGIGVGLTNIEFNIFPNPIPQQIKFKLLSDDIVSTFKEIAFPKTKLADKNIMHVEFINCGFNDSVNLFSNPDLSHLTFKSCDFNSKLKLPKTSMVLSFDNSTFHDNLTFESTKSQLKFHECFFNEEVVAPNRVFENKVRFRKCKFLKNVNFRNTTFNALADFWNSTFVQPITFFKTDFNSTVVFSAVDFRENVLFSYTLFNGKSIFGRTKFKAGFDFSQSIIAGDLQVFDIKFENRKYIAEYVEEGEDDLFQDYIEKENKIPLLNKVATFQILKNQFNKQANHIDEVRMRKYEKISFRELNKLRKHDLKWKQNTSRDAIILWLNRLSNNFRSDFRNGISFTVVCAITALFFTLITTKEFWSRICFNCGFDLDVISYTIKLFIVFLNPTHKIDYLAELEPVFGIAYIIDFLGRIAVGYGIYQTIQAFRKYK